jgi:hypothetical protein
LVKLIDQLQELGFTGRFGKLMLVGENPRLGAGFLLHRHIDPAGRILSHQDHRQTGSCSLRFERADVSGDCLTDLFGDSFAINKIIHVLTSLDSATTIRKEPLIVNGEKS